MGNTKFALFVGPSTQEVRERERDSLCQFLDSYHFLGLDHV